MKHFSGKFNIIKILIELNTDLKLLIDYKLLILFKNSAFSYKYVGESYKCDDISNFCLFLSYQTLNCCKY